MPIINRIAAFHDEMTAWRRDLHAHPEIGLTEHRTAAVIAERLRGFGVDEVITGLAGTGVVGVIRGRAGEASIGLRADIDALPIEEASGVAYASGTPGVMHACGHDGHTAMLLGAARHLAETRGFAGTVYVIFQPAEENAGGARIMIEDGLFERCPMDRVFGLHNWPSLPAGTIAWREGPVMAAVGVIDITITGRGAHGAKPQEGVDPILAAAHVVTALQSLVSRGLDPMASGVVTIGAIHAGVAENVIPERVAMRGTARWFAPEVGDQLEAGVRRVAEGVATGLGASATVRFERTYPVTVNDAAATGLARRAAAGVVGPARVVELAAPSMGAEDFAYMLQRCAGSYVMLGSGRSEHDPGLHHPAYDFNDAVLPVGASYWVGLVETLLGEGA